MAWGWSRSRLQRASERTPSSFSGYKACGQCRVLRKLPQAPLGMEEAPASQVSRGQSWGKGPDTTPSCVSPNQPPRFPLQRPLHHPSQRDGRADTEDPVPLRGWRLQTLLCGGSLRPCRPAGPPACSLSHLCSPASAGWPLSWDLREEAEETFFTFYTYLHMLSLGSPVHRLPRVSHTPRGGLDPELWGSPNLGAFLRRKDLLSPPRPTPPQYLRGAKGCGSPIHAA